MKIIESLKLLTMIAILIVGIQLLKEIRAYKMWNDRVILLTARQDAVDENFRTLGTIAKTLLLDAKEERERHK